VPKDESISALLGVGSIDGDELCVVLSSVLARGAQFRPREVEYRTDADEWAVALQYQDGLIVDAVAGPALTPELRQRLQEVIARELLGDRQQMTMRWTMFSRLPVTGRWRYRDAFQIGPAPADAPRPEALHGQHPFLVDFVFNTSSIVTLQALRMRRTAYELELLLDLLLRPGVTSPPFRNPRQVWVIDLDRINDRPIYAQEGYHIPGFKYQVPELPDDGEIPSLSFQPSSEYYSSRGEHADVLEAPDELEALVDCFNSLTVGDREQFLRACHWHHLAQKLWDQSVSLYLTCFVHAVESLAGVGPDRKDAAKVTTLYKTFMKEHAPGPPSGKRLDAIYDLRGEVTHGARVLSHDRPRAPGLDELSAEERDVCDDAATLVRGALINWLWLRHPEHTRSLLIEGAARTPPAARGTKARARIVVPGHDEDEN
jgi:hypothetical protein